MARIWREWSVRDSPKMVSAWEIHQRLHNEQEDVHGESEIAAAAVTWAQGNISLGSPLSKEGKDDCSGQTW